MVCRVSFLCLMIGMLAKASLSSAQTPVVYKEVDLDTEKCLQVNGYEVVQNEADLRNIPLKYSSNCEAIDIGKISLDEQSLIICSQYVRNGKNGISSSRLEVLRDDKRKRIEVFFAVFGSSSIQRTGKVYEYRKSILLPKFPNNYKIEVRSSIHVVEP